MFSQLRRELYPKQNISFKCQRVVACAHMPLPPSAQCRLQNTSTAVYPYSDAEAARRAEAAAVKIRDSRNKACFHMREAGATTLRRCREVANKKSSLHVTNFCLFVSARLSRMKRGGAENSRQMSLRAEKLAKKGRIRNIPLAAFDGHACSLLRRSVPLSPPTPAAPLCD